MFPLALVACLYPDPSITMADLENFRVPPRVAKVLWEQAVSHKIRMKDEVRSWNNSEVYDNWEMETTWRIQTWNVLDSLLNYGNTVEQKLKYLAELRDLLGEGRYRIGYMPSTIPSYGP